MTSDIHVGVRRSGRRPGQSGGPAASVDQDPRFAETGRDGRFERAPHQSL
ncbi:MAG: hypothetical protein LBJ62_10610 [Bifidobacteriaceae bacterium]|nr:hypothetical protein [Bifidobacteriaceae bacterium]